MSPKKINLVYFLEPVKKILFFSVRVKYYHALMSAITLFRCNIICLPYIIFLYIYIYIYMSIKQNYYTSSEYGITTLSGICPTNLKNIYLLTGSTTGESGLLYKGPIQLNSTSTYFNLNYPNAISTASYGPEYNYTCGDNDFVTVVGSYKIEDTSGNTITNAFVFRGFTSELDDPKKYKTIVPFTISTINVAHSTRNGLVVYVTSNVSPAEFAIGNSGIYDIDKNLTICEVLYPNSFFTTTYGIWYNGIINGFENYTIVGGYTDEDKIKTNSYLVDFMYNKLTGEFYFLNWTTIKVYPEGFGIETHLQGISVLNDNYVCACDNFSAISAKEGNNIQFDTSSLIINRTPDGFKIKDIVNLKYPDSIITSNNSVCENNAVGIYTNSDGIFPFQANFF